MVGPVENLIITAAASAASSKTAAANPGRSHSRSRASAATAANAGRNVYRMGTPVEAGIRTNRQGIYEKKSRDSCNRTRRESFQAGQERRDEGQQIIDVVSRRGKNDDRHRERGDVLLVSDAVVHRHQCVESIVRRQTQQSTIFDATPTHVGDSNCLVPEELVA